MKIPEEARNRQFSLLFLQASLSAVFSWIPVACCNSDGAEKHTISDLLSVAQKAEAAHADL